VLSAPIGPAVAEQLGVPHYEVPRQRPPGKPFDIVPLLQRRWWHEIALWYPEQRTLVCADAVGTAQYYRAPGERLAVSPLLRMTPPRRLLALEPEHVLVGHGEGITRMRVRRCGMRSGSPGAAPPLGLGPASAPTLASTGRRASDSAATCQALAKQVSRAPGIDGCA
jgi:hypothetical protein